MSDPREDYKVTHSLSDMIFLALCGAVANCDHWTEIEIYARNHLKFLKKFVSLSGILCLCCCQMEFPRTIRSVESSHDSIRSHSRNA
ncbi:transposase family protein [Rubinisphaera italica]|uniref:transposase family protein n=1 Tax=Rubinisphaera italica TaxID=2527969 RepID=UPI0011B5C8BB